MIKSQQSPKNATYMTGIIQKLKSNSLLYSFPMMTFVLAALLHVAFTGFSSYYKSLLSWFDAFALAVLVVVNRYVWPKFENWSVLISYVLPSAPLFVVILPMISMVIELDRQEPSGTHDSYESLYALLRFPQYWALGVVQYAIWIAATIANSRKSKAQQPQIPA